MEIIIIIDKSSLDLIMAQMFSNNTLINLLDLCIDGEFVLTREKDFDTRENNRDINYLEMKYGKGNFLINPETLIVYKRITYKKMRYNSYRETTIELGKLVFLEKGKLEIEPIK